MSTEREPQTNPGSGVRRYGPGKYNKVIDEFVHMLTLDGGPDQEIGDVQGFGWYGLLRGNLLEDVERIVEEEGESLTSEEESLLRDAVGAIIYENDQGFVSIDYYTDLGALTGDWARIESDYEEFEAEGEEEEE